jgi:insertion element IS1 protein InsB
VLDAGVGAHVEATGARLFASLARHDFQRLCTDYYRAYCHLIPIHRHYRSKAETTSVESGNSLLRHYLARFRRRTKCYSKGQHMLRQAVLLLRSKKNGTLIILL